MDHTRRNMARLHNRHGFRPRCLELGMGRRRDSLRTSGTGRRRHPSHCGILSRLDHFDGRNGLGMGRGGLGGYEVLPAR